jgi:hypothetical protein
MVNLLKEYWVYYNKKIDFSEKLDSCAKLNEKITGIITENIYRAITKIAFNYFAFCCNEDCNINILHHDSFSYLKKFVRYWSDDRILRNNIINITNEDVLRIEKEDWWKLLTHKIVFFCDNWNIYSNISFNWCFTYKVKLSNWNIDIKSITKYNINDFWCWHMFDPNDDKILRLVNRYNWWTDEAKPKYWLDKRNS